jgi:hypothetical protein
MMEASRASRNRTFPAEVAFLICLTISLPLIFHYFIPWVFPSFLTVELIIPVIFFIAELIYLSVRKYHLIWYIRINTIFLFFTILFIIFFLFQGFGLGPSIVKDFLETYYLQRCCGITHWYDYENKTLFNEHLQQCEMPENITFTLMWNITIGPQALTMLFTASKFAQTEYGFILVLIIVIILLLYFVSELYYYYKDKSIFQKLCVDDKLLSILHSLRLFFTYFAVFSLILYFLLLFLINSEYPSAYLLLITTFLLFIAEASMGRSITGFPRALFVFLLFASVIASGVFTSLVFYLGGFVPSNICMIPLNSLAFQGLASIYASLLPIAAACGAVPYASTLLLLHYRFICGLDEQDEKPGMRNSTDKIHTTS